MTTSRVWRRLLASLIVASLGVALGAPVVMASGPVLVTMSMTAHPASGSSFTFTPSFSDGYVVPADAVCSWELVWGHDDSLRHHTVDEAFGSIALRGKAADGFCDPWTLTLPYSASGEWLYDFGISDANGTWFDTTSFEPGPDFPIFSGTNGVAPGTGIATSSIPGVWLSMPKGSVIGDRVTATAHPIGGYVVPPSGINWAAQAGACYCTTIATAVSHSLTFTFTATKSGTISVWFNDRGEQTGGDFAGAGIDPHVTAKTRVTIHLAASTHVGVKVYLSASAWLFKGTVTKTFYLNGHRWFSGHGRTVSFGKPGVYKVKVLATDTFGHRASLTRTITVLP